MINKDISVNNPSKIIHFLVKLNKEMRSKIDAKSDQKSIKNESHFLVKLNKEFLVKLNKELDDFGRR